MIRVISGKYRSRILSQPNTTNTRPTMDRVREAIFSSIRQDIENKIVLDLFSGSGAFSIEAISNGAMKAVSIENNKEALKVINDNIKALKINNLEVLNLDVLIFLKRYTGRVFDYIFLDPPYKEYETLNSSLELIVNNNFLNNFGKIILETDNPEEIKIPNELVLNKIKKYGKVYVLFIHKNI
ncbi:DNA methylase [Mycoplasmopsis maculosa]|uniref:DNA methylase n=1 Tax=Mycoplasmopsis maculosa TaxID=114885 RepID=A0A449B517_9BACT|nr:16S rRNA (guanine(966)-N(2))-methyltransferase RsmD [Mycoplasmopsis maculosa]VEU75665.1 DNA methylase [Mycoplasmopsis maculosa]